MSEFCENCPMRGEATGEVIGTVAGEVSYKLLFVEQFRGKAGVLVGENGGLSEPLVMPETDDSFKRIEAAIEDCQKPTTEIKGIFKKREVPVSCPAIGRLAITDPWIKEHLTKAAQREIFDFPVRHKPTQS